MNTSLLCLVSVLAAPPVDSVPTVYSPSPAYETVIRGQSPAPVYQYPPAGNGIVTGLGGPPLPPPQQFPIAEPAPQFQPIQPMMAQTPTFTAPVQPGAPVQTGPPVVVPDGGGIPAGPPMMAPVPEYSPVLPPAQPYGQPLGVDPFLSGPGVAPLLHQADPPGMLPVSYSLTGLHPYRFGFTHRLDFGLIPKQDTKRGPGFTQFGGMGFFEFDYENEYTTPIFDRSVFSHTFQYGLRSWNGPMNAGPPGLPFINAIDLPGNVHRFGGDFELTSPLDNPVVFQAGFNPSINTDFEDNLSSRAWNLDARGVVFHRVSPDTTLVGGVLYWDRVDDVFLPYVGVIRKPSPRREYVLVFPNPRISFMINNLGGIAKWFYVRGEYHVEAYQVERTPLTGSITGPYAEQIEIRDWRVLAGFRTENPYGVSTFLEVGAIFGREVEFLNGSTDYDIDSGFIARAGLHF